ncbi:hypothetical protein H4N54_11260 [Limnospira fusiformis KN01]|uniref:Uncharacterized protein n=2 Tax=Limnospira TaxID=2596745 RepID=A0A9P1P0X7_9CYAN|nr:MULTISPECIES: hypothetical protein [Limnospira]EKD06660.1 hypothetical protein SPLC1_S532540 [Arthrospira platensis C1]MDY7051637.1 hypothetical protein [Limnospira fusiformis LS22]EDZ93451.1 conserved hypothetical protein [Limnospira maxima CS-328]MDT9236443.1 hypothetical protein [Limnospira sp. PMC 917.15]MDT9277303.1 hypothetical protein [Limnospira sp. PMC 737.11]
MRKVLFVIVAGVLSLWLGGCASEPPEEEITLTPTPTEETTPVDPSEEETTAETPFEDPLVTETPPPEAGLIQSTKSEERLRQLLPGRNGVPAAPATIPIPGQQLDPFGPVPPVIADRPPDVQADSESIALPTRQVPDLPSLPVAMQPPQWRTPVAVTTVPGQPGAPTAQPGVANGQPGVANGRPGTPTAQPGVANGRPGTPTGQPGVANGRPGTPTGQPGVANGRPGTPTGQPGVANGRPGLAEPVAELPDLAVAGVPDLPQLPLTSRPPAWVDPNAPPPVAPAAPPPPPSTDLARGIEVTGVLRTGDDTRIILKAPNEPTSRYVSVGQRIAGGEVLIKRVKLSGDGVPIVIFEQNGIEVARMVGEVSGPFGDEANTIVMPQTINNFVRNQS